MTSARPTTPTGTLARTLANAFFGALVVLSAQVLLPATGLADDKAQTVIVSPKERAAMEEIVHQYILDHPEVILESIRRLRAREEKADQDRVKNALAAHSKALVADPDSPVGGNPEGDVTIVEFFDYRCGFCKRVLPVLEEVVKTDGKVRVVYKEFPILGEQSTLAAKAALGAWRLDKGKYEAFHFALMHNRGALSEETVMKLAKESGYDPAKVRAAMAAPGIEQALNRNYQLAAALNIQGTPAFIIGDQLAPGAMDLEQFRKLIARARGR